MKKLLTSLLLLWSVIAHSETITNPLIIGGQIQGSQATVSFALPGGTVLPSTCRLKQTFVKTNATSAAQIYVCTAEPSTWTPQGGGGGGGSPAGSTGDLQTNAGSGNFGAITPGTGIATWLATPSSANLAAAVTGETGTGALVFGTSPTLVTPALGTPASGVLTNATGLPIASGVSGLGTGVATALAVNVGSAGAPVVLNGALGTPSSGTLTNATGLPIASGVSGLGTGVATALAVNVGSAGAPVVLNGALGTPLSGTLTNVTGLPIASGVSGLGTGIATWLATPSGANVATAMTSGITNATLANSTITIAGHSVSLGGSQNLAASDLTNGTSGTGAVLLVAAPTFTGTMNGGSIVLTGNITAANLTPSGTLTDTDLCYYTASGGLINCDGPVAANVVTAAGTLTSGQLMAGGGSKATAVTNLSGDVTTSGSVATTIAANVVTSAKMAVVNTRRVCDIAVGDTSGSALTNAQLGPQKRICFIPAASTVVEIDVAADASTPNVIVAKNSAGSVSNLVSSALATAASGGIACSKATAVTCLDGVTTASATLQNTSLAAGDYIELVSGTAGATAKFMTIHIIYTVN